MSDGYGRGYYGASQLDAKATRKRNWFTVAAVVGVGATAAWLLWPRKPVPQIVALKEPDRMTPPPQTPLVVINTAAASPAVPIVATGGFLKQLEDDARSRGFVSVKDYEDSVIMNAKQILASGGQVILAPHLQHLAPQLEGHAALR